MSKQVRYIRDKRVINRDIAGQFILVPQKKLRRDHSVGKLFTLNSTSNFIWEFLVKERSLNQIVQAILKNFTDIDEKVVERDVKDIIKAFLTRNLIFKK